MSDESDTQNKFDSPSNQFTTQLNEEQKCVAEGSKNDNADRLLDKQDDEVILDQSGKSTVNTLDSKSKPSAEILKVVRAITIEHSFMPIWERFMNLYIQGKFS